MPKQKITKNNDDLKSKRKDISINIKVGIEELSGISMKDVRVHYNSNKPSKLKASRFEKGTEISIHPQQMDPQD